MTTRTHNLLLHGLAIATTAVAFPLIFMGGLVTSKGAGMSVPDWPNSFGYNMFLFPPSKWVGGIYYEHSHRLLGTAVGLLALLLAIVAWGTGNTRRRQLTLLLSSAACLLAAGVMWLILIVISDAHVPNAEVLHGRVVHTLQGLVFLAVIGVLCLLGTRRDPRPAVRWLTLAVLLAVIAQGVLGGMRVVLVELGLAVIHGVFAQAVFCLCGLVCLVTAPWWSTVGTSEPSVRGRHLARWAMGGVTAVYLQLIVGAVMRHFDAGLAIPDVPLSYGHLLPPTNGVSLDAANLWRAQSGVEQLRPVTLGQIWLHASHRVGAVLVTLVLSIVIVKTLRIARGVRSLTVPALCLIPLLVIQISLGVLTVLYYKPADLASLHVACGALVLLTSFILAACAVKGFGIRTNEVHEVISIDAPIGPFLRYAGGGIGRGAAEV